MARALFPESGRPDFVPFDDATETDSDASTIERLAAWMGRDTQPWRLARRPDADPLTE